MKIWNTFGSEHSANLVMIGSFKDVSSAEDAKSAIDQISEFVRDRSDGTFGSDRYPPDLIELLNTIKIHTISSREFEQFSYDFGCETDDNKVKIRTEEYDISALLKILLDKGAKVEIYSAHDFPNTGEGR